FGESIVRTVQNKGLEFESLTNIYRNPIFTAINNETRLLSRFEYLIGKSGTEFTIIPDGKTTVPISLIEEHVENINVEITVDNNQYNFNNNTLKKNRFNYLTFSGK